MTLGIAVGLSGEDNSSDKDKISYDELTQTFSLAEILWLDRFLKLLFELPKEKRPDGLLITDDNFLNQAYKTLIKLNVKIGTDIDIISHANFPVSSENHSNIYRLGYHIPEAISSAFGKLRIGTEVKDIIIKPEFRRNSA
jgi:DNA-binding LacI/PurR family transcriptional regulator